MAEQQHKPPVVKVLPPELPRDSTAVVAFVVHSNGYVEVMTTAGMTREEIAHLIYAIGDSFIDGQAERVQ
jgi:hypothetical protein